MGAIGRHRAGRAASQGISASGHKSFLSGLSHWASAPSPASSARAAGVQTAFAVTTLPVVWVCLEAVRIPDLRNLIKQGYEHDAHHHGWWCSS